MSRGDGEPGFTVEAVVVVVVVVVGFLLLEKIRGEEI